MLGGFRLAGDAFSLTPALSRLERGNASLSHCQFSL